ncbi:efflux RND transporter periplasmic adaptor subunit [Rugamonas rubra]|uniref:HlyD family secretion protein n=1 Tax=Rugamonas rubra TaxID=758825 RepID=A0A1I4PF20_9BURK|nr:efflux RND transporter periplasmic adaptor subunit [Rugamonas rubra]SFM26165.1 HlyD family secretion protein [Rugamonas rubra]
MSTDNAADATIDDTRAAPSAARLAAQAGAQADAAPDQAAAASWWRRPRLRRLALLGGAVLLALALLLVWLAQREAAPTTSYRTEPAKRGDLVLSVTANGSLQPTRSVNLGSELSGTVAKVLVDVNDPVRAGQVLVRLDTAKLDDQIVRSRAALAVARAELAQAQATAAEATSALARLEEVARLSGGKVPSRAELETGRAVLARADAAVQSAQAAVVSAGATVSTDATNLAKASIRSPIDGVVLSRSVESGNAVAASLQAVTLFALAEDLHRMRLLVNVDEADVGAVKLGQAARFTVSAYTNRQYPATITRVAYGSTITDNVVTYTTYLDVDNADLSLRPGMTATATIRASGRHDALLVPNSALRFSPATQPAAGGSLVSSLIPRLPGRAPRRAGAVAGAQRQIWVLRDGVAEPLAISTGISDGRMTEVTGGALQAGMLVITDQVAKQ